MPTEDELKEEIEWLGRFIATKLPLVWERARNPHDPNGAPQCFGIAQHATLESEGRLLYHEGLADDKVTGKKAQRHAWNTFHDEIVDLSQTQRPDGSLTHSVNAYDNYQSAKSYSADEVNAVLKRRKGSLDWIENPEYPENQGEQQ